MNLTTVATAVAEALDGAWRNEPGHWGNDRMLLGPAGERVHLNAWPPGRITITGSFTGDQHAEMRDEIDGAQHRISVAEHTPSGKIAGHITRRLLPNYRVALADATERAARSAEREAARAELANKLAAILPGGRAILDGTKVWFDGSGAYGRGELRPMPGGHTVEIDMALSTEHAVAVAELLRDLITG